KGMDDATVTEKLLEEADIAVTPGSAFGPAGAGHLRLSYATSEERIREGLLRMKRWLEKKRVG
ncbi:MAG TPA: pyridoxal phosphate-dependent aminotransferase, partial [Candidatus Thermoplasmatota archaeon]|nr:pyridoxal phosphate-dependent aminotransferase [Candidatus Thermoplasmatota archaeon]